ncbi:Protein HGV2 [Holothuria leucospilota]|uniref:Protein HGV2 n=1 Tax=Holothuria leucospilota TaxID=206669 RepID=A0A9Q1C8N3_HOLLE|nr:Protein HGV2 [Holothuria leucospilota]
MLSETGPSTSSAEQSRTDDVDTAALKLLGEGKRHLLVGDAPTAVTTLQEACEILAAKYGEVSDQCGDSYYHYGNALLELGRMESGVLGNALDGVPEGAATDTDDADDEEDNKANVERASKLPGDERKKVIQQVKDALEATYQQSLKQIHGEGEQVVNGEAHQANEEGKMINGEAHKAGDVGQVNGEKVVNGVGTKVGDSVASKDAKSGADEGKEEKGKVEEKNKAEKKPDEEKVEGKEKKEGVKEAKDSGKEKEGIKEAKDSEKEKGTTQAETVKEKEKEENPDDIPNFQKTDKESKLKVAQVHFKLGELGLETENYAQSLEDFVKCLEIQKEHLEPESRLIAGSHYNLGLAYTFDSKMEKALEHFKHAKQTIEERVKKLEKDVTEHEEKKEEKYEETVTKLKDEIKELNELIPDILAKIEDAKDAKNQQPFGETSSGFGQSSSGASSSSAAPMQIQVKRKTDNATVTDISHLVKRKRTDESSDSHSASAAGDATEAKRTKQDEANSTSGDSNQVNGGPDASTTKDEKATAMET